MDIKNRKILIAGLGETGYDTAIFLLGRGARVFVTEGRSGEKIGKKAAELSRMGARVETGGHTEEFARGAEILVPSPGVPEKSLPLALASRMGIPVLSEIELAYAFSPSRKIISITGTDGKTTTSSMLGLMFCKAGLPYVVCGNIGNSFIGEVENISPETFVILEASSFQLEKTVSFRPFTACLLNIDEDHLDRHVSFENYLSAKARMFFNQEKEDNAVINYDDSNCRNLSEKTRARVFFFSREKKQAKGAYASKGAIYASVNGAENAFSTLGMHARGPGNIENSMACVITSLLCGLDPAAIQEALSEFKPLAHRFEKVAEINGVLYINDSKATNPHSVMNALKSVVNGGKAILIMGGQNKNVSFEKLVPMVRARVKALVLLGEASETIEDGLKGSGVACFHVRDMGEAVRKSADKAEKGDWVILSPGCASFDMFENYKERGDVFKKEVELLQQASDN